MEEGAWKKREQRVHAGSLLTDILLEYNRILWSQSFAKEAGNFFSGWSCAQQKTGVL